MKNSQTLPETTAMQIIEYITTNNMKPKDRIPSEPKLCELLGVGRSTLREAIRILVSRNILEIKRGSGTYISSNTGVNSDPLGFQFADDKYKLAKDLLEVRVMLEPEIAMLSAIHATDEELLEIKKVCDEIDKKIEQDINHTSLDIKFHELIAKSSGNDVIGKLMPIIVSAIEISFELTHSKLKVETIKAHRLITNALINRNPVDAKHFMTLHILHNKTCIDDLIGDENGQN